MKNILKKYDNGKYFLKPNNPRKSYHIMFTFQWNNFQELVNAKATSPNRT